MSVKIRLARLGKKNRPYWRLVAIDSRKKRDGACLEDLGTYDPLKSQIIQIHHDRIADWISKGAQCSETVARLVKMSKRSLQQAVKS